MVLGWRRAFCTSFPPERDSAVPKEKPEKSSNSNSTPKVGSKFGFFSNTSTPRLQSQPVSSPSFRGRATATIPPQSVPEAPKLQCKTKYSPRSFQRSNPSSPRSPSTFSLLKSSLRFSKTRCGICLQSVKTGQRIAIFTAECSHSFHFPCIAAQLRKNGSLQLHCPVCSSPWKELPLLSIHNQKPGVEDKITTTAVLTKNEAKQQNLRSVLKVYNDDEPLMSPTSGARFNPIPESDENGDEENDSAVEEFQGFFVNSNTSPVMELKLLGSRNVQVSLLPEAAVISVGRSSETHAIVLKVRAPPAAAKAACRAPIDLVTVLDVSGSMTTEKLKMMKRAMRLIVSSLSSDDRLSIVAFSATSKRLLPLRRMSTNGRRSARRIVEALAVLQGTSSAPDALKKAAKVLEDRRERNPVASIILLSDCKDEPPATVTSTNSVIRTLQSSFVSSTRHAHLEIPVHSFGFSSPNGQEASEDDFANCVAVLRMAVQDLWLQLGFVSGSAPAEIAAVYSYAGGPISLGSGSIRLGNLHGEEERELLVELKVPSLATGAQHVLSVRCSYKDPSSQELIHSGEHALLVPLPHGGRSSAPGIERLRNLFISTRAVAESRRLIERNDLTGAYHMLSSARALLSQSGSASAKDLVRSLDADLSELSRKRQNQTQQNQRRRTNVDREVPLSFVDEKGEPLTPTSAWKAAERLAKVAIMRKSLNRVSDLHGFENARF